VNVVLNIIMGAAIVAGIFLAMRGAGVDMQTALSTAILVGATAVVPAIKSDNLVDRLQTRRKIKFERCLDVSRDHVKHIVKETVTEVLPDDISNRIQ